MFNFILRKRKYVCDEYEINFLKVHTRKIHFDFNVKVKRNILLFGRLSINFTIHKIAYHLLIKDGLP